jgi:hypothetical protein
MPEAFIIGYRVEDYFIAEAFFATVNSVDISGKPHDTSEEALEEARSWVQEEALS